MSDKAKYPVGILVEFSNDRLVDEYNNDLDVNHRFVKGQKGYVVSVSPTKVTKDVALDNISIVSGEFYYTIKRGLTSIEDVPESDLFNPNSELSMKIEERLRKAQEDKEFKDTEGRIGGSKKEKMAYKMISLSNLADIEQDEATAIELVKKEKVFPKIDVVAERDKGVSSGAAYLKFKLREAFGAQPPNNKDKRKIYVGYVDYLFKAFQNIYSVKDFRKFSEDALYNGIEEVVKAFDPEAYEAIQESNAIIESRIESLKAEEELIKDKIEHERELMKERHPELANDTRTGFYYAQVPDEEKKYESELNDIRGEVIINIQTEYRSLRNVVNEFLVSIGANSAQGRSYATFMLFEEIFGVRLVNFIRQSSDAVVETYEEAFDFEGVSKEESDKLIGIYSLQHRESLEKKQNQLNELDAITSKAGYDTFFNYYAKDNIYSGGELYIYGKKGLKYADCNTEKKVMDFKSMFIHFAKESIEDSKKRIAKIEHKYRARENNWDWAFDKKATKEQKEKVDIKINTYPPLSYIKRTGGIEILESDVNPESIRAKFGFKEVEFGQSLKDSEAREHVRHFLGAMADLADILNLNIVELNKLGGISIAFASRGAGKASAHYESLRRIINITKVRGGGAVAHEYMHYLDNIIPSISRSNYQYGDFASKATVSSYGRKDYKISSDIVKRALDDIFLYIYERKINGVVTEGTGIVKEVIEANSQNKYSLSKGFYNNTTKQYETPTDIESYMELFTKSYSNFRYIERMTKRDYAVLAQIVHKFGFKSYEFSFKSQGTSYYANSLSMSSDYWVREWELLARAFETYMYDKLEQAGRANNYLVSGAYFDSPRGVYPQGDERKALFLLYDVFVKAVKSEYGISDFNAWTDKRVDEYVALDEDKNEKVTAGVIVDESNGELLESLTNPAALKDKFKELLFLLTNENKFKDGGEIDSISISDKLLNYLKNS